MISKSSTPDSHQTVSEMLMGNMIDNDVTVDISRQAQTAAGGALNGK